MNQKTKGTISLICGIVCIVASLTILVLRFVLGEELVGNKDILMCPVWIALGVYFCYSGRKMKKKNDE